MTDGIAPPAAPLTRWRDFHDGAFEAQRVLITGGAGFIGSHLAAALADLGAHVVLLDDLSGGDRANLPSDETAAGRVELEVGSILNKPLLARCIRGCRYVFHQAAMGSVPRSVEQPRLFHDVNATGTLNVLEAARAAGTQRMTFAASSSAYGQSEVLPKIETMAALPLSPYAATKVAGEALLAAYAASYRLDTVSLRYFNIFGPRQNANSAYAAVIAAFASALLRGERPSIYGDGEQSRDFTYVDNVVHANLLAARLDRPLAGEVVNVACGQRITVNALVRMMAGALGRPDLTPLYHPARPGDVLHSLADLSRARAVLGYEPIVDFESGLRATVQWYAEKGRHV